MLCPTVRSTHCLHNFGISKAAEAAPVADRRMNNRNSSIKHVESRAAFPFTFTFPSASAVAVAVPSLTAHVRASGKWQQHEEQLEATGVVLCLLSYVSVLGLAKHFEMQAAVCPARLLPACPPRSRNFQSVPIVARSVTSFIDPR